MDSFNYIRIEDASDDLINIINEIQPIGEEHAPLAWKRIAVSQMLEDRWQLYEMFCWNYDRYSEGLESYISDRVMTRAPCCNADKLFRRTRIDANCFATNLISSGVTLVESIRCFMSSEVEGDCPKRQIFENYLKELFDKHGVYPLMTKFRDAAQHGQPLVSLYVDDRGDYRASFDLDQLLRPEHFSVKGILRNLMEEKIAQMDELDAPHHRISYTWCMERYFIEVLKVAAMFYSCSTSYITNLDRDFGDFIKSHRECVGELPDGREIALVNEDNTAHMLIGIETPLFIIHSEHQKSIENRLAYAEDRYDTIKASTHQS